MNSLWKLTKVSSFVLFTAGLVACGGSSNGGLVVAPDNADTFESPGSADTTDTVDLTDSSGNSDTSVTDSDNTDNQSEPVVTTPVVNPAPPVTREIEGSWTTGCFPFEGGGDSQSRVLTLVIEGETSVFTTFSYSDLNCSVPVTPISGVIATESSNTDSLEFPEETVTTSLGEASFINFTTESFTTDGVTVSGGGTVFTIFIIDDEDRLFFGAGSGNSPETRPATLDLFFFYTRS